MRWLPRISVWLALLSGVALTLPTGSVQPTTISLTTIDTAKAVDTGSGEDITWVLALGSEAAAGEDVALMAVVTVPGVLLWAALPVRPRLRGPVGLDPVLAPVALLVTAALAPYAVDQLALQNATTTGYHSENPHLFDMAWVTTVLMVLAVLGAVVRPARGLVTWVGGGCTAIGAAGLLLGEPSAWSGAVLAVGLLALVATRVGSRRNRP